MMLVLRASVVGSSRGTLWTPFHHPCPCWEGAAALAARCLPAYVFKTLLNKILKPLLNAARKPSQHLHFEKHSHSSQCNLL